MKRIPAFLTDFLENIRTTLIYDDSRTELLFAGLNIVLSIVSFVMTVVNFLTKEFTLMSATFAFSLLCVLDAVLIKRSSRRSLVFAIFGTEVMLLLAFFVVSGIPDGFSAIWLCLIPSFALLLFGMRDGAILCAIALLMMIFFFWLPFGKSLLMFEYSETFMLRFPFLYSAIFAIACLFEYVRRATQSQLFAAEEKYRYLYRHDALTGLYNRYGINEYIDKAFKTRERKNAAIMILDIDFFKAVNDNYGHEAGDAVLRTIAELPKQVMCSHCQFGRWGGEEFLILMQCRHDPEEIAEKVRALVEQTPICYKGTKISVTVSIGVCLAKDVSRVSIAQVINQADKCLYHSKENGRNQVTFAVLEP